MWSFWAHWKVSSLKKEHWNLLHQNISKNCTTKNFLIELTVFAKCQQHHDWCTTFILITIFTNFYTLTIATFDPIWQSSESAAFCRKILQLYLTKKGGGPPWYPSVNLPAAKSPIRYFTWDSSPNMRWPLFTHCGRCSVKCEISEDDLFTGWLVGMWCD